MDVLQDDQSRKLFFNTVFRSNKCPAGYRRLETISGNILAKCGGLPLAIVSVGGMLAQAENKTPAEWMKVCDRLGSGLSTSAMMERMRRIMSLSYHDLPYHLKACFLYLSVFREGYEIKRGPLVRRWAAEGFVGGRRECTPEEAAGKYLDEFVGRSIVTPTRVVNNGVVRCCKVHDIMLEMMTEKCMEENFISLLGSPSKHGHQQHAMMVAAGHDKIRRLSVHGAHTSQGKQAGGVHDKHLCRRRIKKDEEQDDVLSSGDLSCVHSLLMLRIILRGGSTHRSNIFTEILKGYLQSRPCFWPPKVIKNNENALLEFVRVVEAKEQVVAGTLHHLTLEALEAGRKKVYEAKVWVKPWLDFKELQEFRNTGDATTFTNADLGAKKGGHEPGWRDVPVHDPVVKDAADHAVKSIQQRSNSLFPYELLEIVRAKAEVVEDFAKV
ncbi:hypothetical protein OsI_01337 [Oryza sativa Indica Group]|uniref:Cystatin domain-containing protein n=1 Tax=Oryza sativa subsp. indica TaxID=39946 RepID=B8AC95_ORYSI|nr:hypothetical protein OsI_01337 [Oryza sativa Indica Group]